MRAIQWIFIMLSLSACTSPRTPSSMPELVYTDEVYTPAAFIPHVGTGSFKNYLAMNLPYEGYQPILQQLESRLQKSLKNRGEAHITVITPVEYGKVLSRHLKMQDIQSIADNMQIQKSPYRPLCLGQGQLKINGKEETTYFVVVESEALFQIRKSIEELYLQKGGKSGEFKAEMFFPHVTLGYTERDLHYEDGVTKDAASCIYKMEPGPRSK